MKIACNWSESLGALLANGQVHVDCIKMGVYGDFDRQFQTARALKPILLHGLGCFDHSGMRSIGLVDFRRANVLLAQCGSPHYGLHLAIQNADMDTPMSDDEIHALMSRQIQVFKSNLRVPLLLENTPDSPQDRTVFDHRPYAEADKISRLLRENGVGLLLDLTHAKITALYRGWNIYEFLRGLPLDRIREIHVNGSGYDDQGFPADTHQAMDTADYDLLEWVLGLARPDVVTLEYNGVSGESAETVAGNLRSQLAELRRLPGRVAHGTL